MIVITLDSMTLGAIVLLFLICWLYILLGNQRRRGNARNVHQHRKKRHHSRKMVKHTHIHLT